MSCGCWDWVYRLSIPCRSRSWEASNQIVKQWAMIELLGNVATRNTLTNHINYSSKRRPTHHDPLLQIATNLLQHLRWTDQFRYIQLEIGSRSSKTFHGRIAQCPFLGMQASRIGDLLKIHEKRSHTKRER